MSEKPEDFDAWVRGAYEDDEKPTPETCQNCARLQRYAETAWNRGHAMGMKANEDIARQATEALRAEKAAHADTNAMLTASLMDAERQRDALADALRDLLTVIDTDPGPRFTVDAVQRARAILEAKP